MTALTDLVVILANLLKLSSFKKKKHLALGFTVAV